MLLNSLGMSGRWTLSGPDIAFTPGTFAHGASIGTGDGPHDHLVIEFEGGIQATYTDARRFGYVHFIEPGCMDDDPFLRVLGPDHSTRVSMLRYLQIVYVGGGLR